MDSKLLQGLIQIETYDNESTLIKRTFGIMLKDLGYIIASSEILENCAEIITVQDNKRIFVEYAWLDLENHILILKSIESLSASVSLGNSNHLQVEEKIFIANSRNINLFTESRIIGLSKLQYRNLYGVRIFDDRYFEYLNFEPNETFQLIYNSISELIGIFTRTKTSSNSNHNYAIRMNELKYFNSEIDFYPVNDIVTLYNAEFYYRRNKFGKAIEKYNIFLNRFPDNYEILLERSKAYLKKKDINSAIKDCDRAITNNIQSALANAIKAYAYYFQKDYSKAAELFSESIVKNALIKENYFNASFCFQKISQYENAFALMNALQEMDPNIAAIYQIKGDLYYKNKLYGKAIEMYIKALNLDKEHKGLYYFLGLSHYNAGNIYEALDYSKKAVEVDKEDPYLFHLKAQCLYELNTDLSEVIYNESLAINLQPDNPLFYYWRASFYFTNADFEKSVQDIIEHVNLASEFVHTQNYLSMVLKAAKDAKAEDDNFFNFSFSLIEEIRKVSEQKKDQKLEDIYRLFFKEILGTLQPIFLTAAIGSMDNIFPSIESKYEKNNSITVIMGRKIFISKSKDVLIEIFKKLKQMACLSYEEVELNELLDLHFIEHKEHNNPDIEYTKVNQIKWIESQPFLIYVIYRLTEHNIISPISIQFYNKLIVEHFYNAKLDKPFNPNQISKQTADNTDPKKKYPKSFIEFDTFLNSL